MKTLDQLQKQRKLWDTFTWVVVALAVLCAIGLVVCIVLFGLNKVDGLLAGILGGSFLIGGVAFGGFGFWCFRRGDKFAAAELDALELADGPYSFFVGEGTFATFRDDALFIHGNDGKRKITVPYYDLRFFSICTRRAPKEHGQYSIIIEIPARYLNNGAQRDMAPALIQTDGKERLYSRLKALDREIIGDLPEDAYCTEPDKNKANAAKTEKKFTRLEKFSFPDGEKRKRSVILMIFGALIFAGGILATIFWTESVNSAISSVIIILGGYVGIRATLAFIRAKALFCIYEEGIFYSEPTGVDNVFLKWDEFSDVSRFMNDGKLRLRVKCPYGAYEFPLIEKAYEYIKEHYPEKVETV